MPDKKELLREKLTTTRDALFSYLRPLTRQQWEMVVHVDPEPWTVADMLGHLVNAERSMTGLINNIREGGEGASPDFDLNRWNQAMVRRARAKIPADLFEDMNNNRARLLETLEMLTAEDFTRVGRHGSMRLMSIEELLNLLADHEQEHLEQIQRALTSKNRSLQ